MLSITKQTINSQKKEIRSFAFNQFGATFISVMNGKNTYLQRDQFGYAHLRFTKTMNIRKDGSGSLLDPKDYIDTYVYVTTSTTTDKSDHDFDASDRCFNISPKLLEGSTRACNFIFLVDYGDYWMYCTKEWARNHVVKYGNFKGREIVTIRLPNEFYKKEKECLLDKVDLENNSLKFDATYIQNVTYNKYRMRKGLRVEVFDENGKLIAVKLYVSTGAFADEMRSHSINYQNQTVQKWARENMTKEINGKKWKFSFVKDINISSVELSSTNHMLEEHNDNHYILTNKDKDLNLNLKSKNVMVNIMTERHNTIELESNEQANIKENNNNEEIDWLSFDFD